MSWEIEIYKSSNPFKWLLGEAFDLSTTLDFYEFIMKKSQL